jgi:F0F1-type ATP synthase membrane subunit b/b'
MTFFEVLTAAINDIIEYGFDSKKRIDGWLEKIKKAAEGALLSDEQMQAEMEKALNSAFTRMVTKGGLVNKTVSKYDIEKLKPKLRAELDRRIMASANLIKYNREKNINEVLQRFEGWATSIPTGGSKAVDRVKEKQTIKKSLTKMPFEQRRVVIDQTHKLVSNINEIVATDNGAIAARWHSHWRQPNYNYRKDHKERDDKVYVIRNSWAHEKGYIKPVNGYTDDITSPGEEVYCRCNYVYLYNLRQVQDLLTKKGEAALQSAKIV